MRRVFTPVEKKTILIIDDDQMAVHIYRERFQRHGFKVEVAESANSALQKIRKEPAALGIIDLCMPEVSGIDMLKDIRAAFDTQALPVIAFVNPYLGYLERAAVQAGATKCVAKTDNMPGQMLDLVCELLGENPSSADRVGTESERAFQEKLVASVLGSAPDTLAKLRASHQTVAKAQMEALQQDELHEMHRQLRSVAGSAGLLGFRKIAQMVTALEALFIELIAKPQRISPSVTRTIAQAIDTLASLLDQAATTQDEIPVSPKIAVVDDEIISRETICSALGRANLDAVSLDDPLAAQRLLEQEHFDLIFLDVEMPQLSGLQLCVKIRETATNSSTPVVFVTSHSDFGSRAQSTLSGGNDFIAKPFLLVELAVKALTWLFKKAPPSPAQNNPLGEPLSHESQSSADDGAVGVPEESVSGL